MILSPEILIHVGRRIRGANRGYVPSVPSNVDRYREFKDRMTKHLNEVPVNNFPWQFRQAKPAPKRKSRKKTETVTA